MEIFWQTIAQYNASTWIWQLLIILTGIMLTAFLVCKPNELIKKVMKGYMIFISLWIAFAYYYVYCDQRRYNSVLTLFWCIMAATWLWDLVSGYTTFERRRKYDILAWILLAMPFIYPLFSIIRGLSFPEITTPLMPCSVAVFMIGLLLLYSCKVNMLIALLLCHWAIIGFAKTYFFLYPKIFYWQVHLYPHFICFSGNIIFVDYVRNRNQK